MKKYFNKEFGKDILADIIGSGLLALGIVVFAAPAHFAPGGVSGLSLIINYLTKLPIGATQIVLNLPLAFISYKVIGKEFLFRSFRTIIISSLLIDLVFPYIPVYTGERFLAALFAGVTVGAGLAIVFMRGSSTGGTDFIIVSLKKIYPHMSLGTITLLTDLIVIALGIFVYKDIDSFLYGVIETVTVSVVMDKFMLGSGGGKLLIIITNKSQEIADKISKLVDRGSTMVNAKGMYKEEQREMLYCACSNRQVVIVRRAVHDVDPTAFIMIQEATEVVGEGFKDKDADEF